MNCHSPVGSDTSSSYSEEDVPTRSTPTSTSGTGVWSKEEHAKFLEAIKIYSRGPWKLVAAYVGTRNVRQTMTHAQKYRQKAARRLRGLRTKQALMRMDFGHYVSEEFLMQERMRSIRAHNKQCLLSEPIDFPVLAHSGPQNSHYTAETFLLEPGVLPVCSTNKVFGSEVETTPWIFPEPVEDPVCLDAILLDIEDVDLVEDSITSPSLEECATELLALLF
ncbi:hypothetical protein PHYBOEH_000393 [Phytophthora boehmeriae]|uniref:Myb-like DNA-binding protein n=1 Tax=Phytophthora boehmeriae TaxID=109152 RepID=A0A8T1WXS6_9STRA|nr:hypothetical protein PHYBOEH_000393 [Phytophthora boehmeriae]